MGDAREIIADTVPGTNAKLCHGLADAIINRLEAAGYRILGPDEVDQLERLAKGDIPGVWQEKFEKAQEIVRTLGRKA